MTKKVQGNRMVMKKNFEKFTRIFDNTQRTPDSPELKKFC